MSSAEDIRLVADNNKTILEYWASEQPADPSVPFRVDALLLPEYWLQTNGEPATRPQLMMALLRLEKIKLKVSYFEKPKQGVIENFELEAASQDGRYVSLSLFIIKFSRTAQSQPRRSNIVNAQLHIPARLANIALMATIESRPEVISALACHATVMAILERVTQTRAFASIANIIPKEIIVSVVSKDTTEMPLGAVLTLV